MTDYIVSKCVSTKVGFLGFWFSILISKQFLNRLNIQIKELRENVTATQGKEEENI